MSTPHTSPENADRRLVTLTDRRTYTEPSGRARVIRSPGVVPGVCVLRASGEFDIDTVSCLRQALAESRAAGDARTVLDLSRVGFGDSTFLHLLVAAHYQQERLVLAGPLPHHLRRLFLLTGVEKVLDFAADLGTACRR
ncbi:STAS domain-containing protein [Streptomyces sp. NPDC006551]|uniref:STAS domain-containing protein n=1 Tax=Streptomyces sp. NPDC006551 TaxID=3157178 RepID=UPI0033B18E85